MMLIPPIIVPHTTYNLSDQQLDIEERKIELYTS